MRVKKQTVVEFIKARGDKERVGEAEQKLPDVVDTDEHADLLAELGVEPDDLDDDPAPYV